MSTQIKTDTIRIPAHDGGAFKAYVALPTATTAPAILVIQEIFGVNQEMRDKCDALARQGYVAVCPDLFWRIEPGIELVDSDETQLQRAFDLFGQFNQEKGLEDLKTALGYMRHYKPAKKQKIGCIGFCLGGRLAYMMSTHTDIDAAVSYYGVGIEDMLEQKDKIDHPTMLHIAAEDQFVSKDAQVKIIGALEGHPHVTLHTYEGVNHAFARDGGMHYNKETAELANSRTQDFLSEHLSN